MKKLPGIVLFCLSSLLLPSCKSADRNLTLIGYDGFKNYSTNAIFLAAEDLNLKPNLLLSKTKSSYRDDLRVIEENPFVYTATNKYQASEIIDNSSAVVFSYRLGDVLGNFKTSSEYDVTLKDRDLALLDYYLELTLDEFSRRYDNTKVAFIGVYNELADDFLDPAIEEANEIIKQKANEYNYSYIDCIQLKGYLTSGVLQDNGIHILSQSIKDFYHG